MTPCKVRDTDELAEGLGPVKDGGTIARLHPEADEG